MLMFINSFVYLPFTDDTKWAERMILILPETIKCKLQAILSSISKIIFLRV